MLIIITAKQLKNYGRIVLLIAVWLASPKGYANQIMDEMWLSVRLNEQQRADTTVFLRATDGALFVAEQDWQQWRLKKPAIPSYQYNQQNKYYLKYLCKMVLIVFYLVLLIHLQYFHAKEAQQLFYLFHLLNLSVDQLSTDYL